jgi:hypothetical protein
MISAEQATTFCCRQITLLAEWPSLEAALQSGGLEVKATGLIGAALEELAAKDNLLVLREYKQIDFALIARRSVGEPQLTVDTVIEVKFNYAQQLGEIKARLPDAIEQADRYRRMVSAKSAYVLYLVAAPFLELIPPCPRDSGWRYWHSLQDDISPLQIAIDEIDTSAHEASAHILGHKLYEHDRRDLYCALVECPSPTAVV